MQYRIKSVQCIVIICVIYMNKTFGLPDGNSLDISDKDSVKKDLQPNKDKIDTAIINKTAENSKRGRNNATVGDYPTNSEPEIPDNLVIQPIQNDTSNIDMFESIKNIFILLTIVGIAAVVFITWKVCRLRGSLAERRYGVHGDRGAQELTPLPMAIEDEDSDTEDHTVFDINSIR